MIRLIGILLLTLASFSCDWLVNDNSDKKPAKLQSDFIAGVADTVAVEGKMLTLETYLNRDFMPVAPSDGQPLYVVCRLLTTDSSALPADIRGDAVWVINGNEQWAEWLKDERPDDPVTRLEWVARGGPKWAPGILVDVVMRFFDDAQNRYYLIARDQRIERTD